MQVSVEALSNIQRRVTVTVPMEQFDAAYDKQIDKLARTAKVDGFRAGKVPLTYIKQQYGEKARQEVLGQIIQKSLYDAINQEKLKPVSTPLVEPKAIEVGRPLEFVATFEVLPRIDVIHFDAAVIEKQTAEITENDLNNVIEKLRQQQVIWKLVDRAAQEKDQVTIDFNATLDGKPVPDGQAENYAIVIGSKMMVPGFEEGLIGMKAGEEKILHLTFPDNYFAKEIAGKATDFTIKLKKVAEPKLPELNEAFAKNFGVKSGNLDELRADVKKNLERELERVIQSRLKNQVFNRLLEQNPIEVPNALIENEAKHIHAKAHPHHGHEDHQHSAEEMKVYADAAKRSVTLGILVEEFVRRNNITLSKEKVQQHIEKIASIYQDPTKVMNWYTSNKRGVAEVQSLVLEEQVMEKLLEHTRLTEKVVSYDELVNQPQNKGAS